VRVAVRELQREITGALELSKGVLEIDN
jgi:hypothetical protein